MGVPMAAARACPARPLRVRGGRVRGGRPALRRRARRVPASAGVPAKTEKLKSCEGNPRRGAGFQVPRFPPSHPSRRASAVPLHCPRHGGRRVTDTPAERGAESTWARLRRRKVVQWGLLYVAAAWGFLQGLEYVSEAFHWPDQLRQIPLLALLIGLPLALVVAYYHGDRGQQRITTPEFAILTLLLLLGGGAFWYYQRASDAEKTAVAEDPKQSTAPPEAGVLRLAVLPLENLSPDPENAFFADGLHDEILSALPATRELQVLLRTIVPLRCRQCGAFWTEPLAPLSVNLRRSRRQGNLAHGHRPAIEVFRATDDRRRHGSCGLGQDDDRPSPGPQTWRGVYRRGLLPSAVQHRP